jgi:hypothetical protein
MNKLILEEIERMSLLSKYDNSKTLSEQTLTPNQKAAMDAGFGPVDTKYADQLASQGKLKAGAKPVAGGKPTTGGKPDTGGKPIVSKQPTVVDKLNQVQKSLGQKPSFIDTNPSVQLNKNAIPPGSLKNIPDTSKGQGSVKNKTTQKPATPVPSQLKDTNGVKSFQDWLDKNASGWATGYKGGVIDQGKGGGGYGKFGPRTQKAWKQYKDQYLKSKSIQPIELEPIQSKGIKELPVTAPQEPQAVKLQPQQQVTYTKRR